MQNLVQVMVMEQNKQLELEEISQDCGHRWATKFATNEEREAFIKIKGHGTDLVEITEDFFEKLVSNGISLPVESYDTHWFTFVYNFTMGVIKSYTMESEEA